MPHERALAEKFRSGISKIDHQHQYLFNRIDSLRRLLDRPHGFGSSDLEEILDDMFDFFQEHFTFEEGLLHRHPRLTAHKKKHQRFIDATKEFERRLFTDPPQTLATEMYAFLDDWLQDHIVHDDLRYFAYLREHNFIIPGMT